MRRRIRNRKTLLAVVAAAATALALSGGAVAYYSSAGHGSGSASVASPDPLSIAAQTPTANLLYPGGSGEVDATVSNPNPFPVRINSLVLGSGGIGVDSAHSGCDTSAVHFTSQNNGGAGWDVPARIGTTDGTLDLATPRRDQHGHLRRERVPGRDLHDLAGDGPVKTYALGRRRRWRRSVGLRRSRDRRCLRRAGRLGNSGPGHAQDHCRAAEDDQPGYATFGYSSTPPVDFLCSLDAGAFAACGSGTTGSISYAGPLADGAHTSGSRRNSERRSENLRRRPGRSTRRPRRRPSSRRSRLTPRA